MLACCRAMRVSSLDRIGAKALKSAEIEHLGATIRGIGHNGASPFTEGMYHLLVRIPAFALGLRPRLGGRLRLPPFARHIQTRQASSQVDLSTSGRSLAITLKLISLRHVSWLLRICPIV